ncbi:MAG: outer membrane protein assembly factor BamA [Parvularculaceae bacterium]
MSAIIAVNLNGAASAQALLGGAADPAASEEALLAAEANIIRGIGVRGNQRIEAQTIASYLVVQPGDVADERLLDLGVKTLFRTGLFSDVTIAMQPDGTLVIDVEENPIVNRVIFEGNKRVKEDKILEEVQLAARSVFTRDKVQNDVQSIIEVYRRTGRFAATVTPKVKPLEQNRVDVIFEIDEGPKTGVAKVNFIGNEAFSANELRGELLTKESRWWRLFSSNSNYDPDRLEFERDLLRQFYARNGYADFQVVSAVAELTPDRKDFFITFTVDEGEKYDIGEVRVKTTLARLDEGALERIVPIRSGQTYDGDRVEKAVESITFATGALGYAFVDVQPRLDRNPATKTIDLTFQVNEGPRVYVERININGNTRTLDKVIRRELRVVAGDAFNRVLVDRSKARIRALGYFGEVEIEETPGSGPDRTELDVAVKEQSTGSFSVGVGVSSTENFILDFSIEERNLLGRGQFLRLRAQASSRTRLVDLRFTQPYFLDRNLAAGFSIFNSRTNFREVGIVRNRVGFGLNAGFQVSEFGRGSIQYQLARDNIEFDQAAGPFFTTSPDEFIAQEFVAAQISAETTAVTDLGRTGVQGQDSLGTTQTLFQSADGDFFLAGASAPLGIDDNGQIILSADADGAPVLTVDPTGLDPVFSVIAGDTCELVDNSFNPQCTSRGQFLTSLVGYSLSFDTRDDPIDTTRGWRVSLAQSVAGLGGDVNYVRTEGSGAYHKRLFGGFIGRLRLRAGYIDGFAGDTVRVQDRFFEGASTFRGFEVAGVGPRFLIAGPNGELQFDNDGEILSQAIGAKIYAIGTAEIRIPLPLPPEYGIRAAIFSDFGTVGLVDDADKIINDDINQLRIDPVTGVGLVPVQDDLGIRVSAGVSVSWDSPFGPVRFDFAEVLRKEEFDQTEGFRFSAGTSF